MLRGGQFNSPNYFDRFCLYLFFKYVLKVYVLRITVYYIQYKNYLIMNYLAENCGLSCYTNSV